MVSTDFATKAQIVTLKSLNYPNSYIEGTYHVSKSTIKRVYQQALSRGFQTPGPVLSQHIKKAPRSGRPRKQKTYKDKIIKKVHKDRYSREKSYKQIAFELKGKILITIVWRILQAAGIRKTKPTRKPGLTKAMRQARLKFCKDHKDWTLEDWKNIIWSDKTSVLLGSRRGGYRIWREPREAITKSCIRKRWKGHAEFMFWGCYSYDRKGPCHIWTPETAQEKKLAD